MNKGISLFYYIAPNGSSKKSVRQEICRYFSRYGAGYCLKYSIKRSRRGSSTRFIIKPKKEGTNNIFMEYKNNPAENHKGLFLLGELETQGIIKIKRYTWYLVLSCVLLLLSILAFFNVMALPLHITELSVYQRMIGFVFMTSFSVMFANSLRLLHKKDFKVA